MNTKNVTDLGTLIPFTNIADRSGKGGDFDVPPLLINPAASSADLMAVAVGRLSRLRDTLDLIARGSFDDVQDLSGFSFNLQASVEEVLYLLEVVHGRISRREQSTSGEAK